MCNYAAISAFPKSGVYEIHSSAAAAAAARVYIPGQPVYVSRPTEDAMSHTLFELTAGNENKIALRSVGLGLPVTVDNDGWVSTSTFEEDLEDFVLEAAAGHPGYFVLQIHSVVSPGLVWTLNPTDEALTGQRIRLAPRVPGWEAQRFAFRAADTPALEHLLVNGDAYAAFGTAAPVQPGVYRILDILSRAPVRSGALNQSIYSTRSADERYPGNTALWRISHHGDPADGVYTFQNVALNLRLGVTAAQTLAPTYVAPAATFAFQPASKTRAEEVFIRMADNSGAWVLDFSKGVLTTQIRVLPEHGTYTHYQTFILERQS
ncbi:unnamed protein product [Mycena citricolor]|uniref:Uncharacterized protein n=1 Tax=Mycena citricolor TaxID=2018698 RepID=A0AAD2HVR0_9AGAR|nr:unnamed protein product [Mycena citricolor]